jgi:exonuclease III
MDQLTVWVHNSNPDVLVITETWLIKSVLNTDVNLSGYIFCCCQDRSSKSGGAAIFTKDHIHCSVVSIKSAPKQFDFLVLNIKLSNSTQQKSTNSYRPPSAPACTPPAQNSLLAPYTKSEFVLLGDQNWDMLKTADQVLKQ